MSLGPWRCSGNEQNRRCAEIDIRNWLTDAFRDLSQGTCLELSDKDWALATTPARPGELDSG